MVYRKRKFLRKPKSFVKRTSKGKIFRKRFQKSHISTIQVHPRGIASQLFVKLPYESTTVYSPSATLRVWQFQSSAYDPDLTFTGHQPRYYDQWTALYGKYQVMAIKATMRCINNGAQACFFGYQWNNFSNTPSVFNDISEGRYAYSTIVSTAGSRNDQTIKTFMKVKNLFGQRSIIQQEDTQSLINTSPTDMIFLNVGTQAVDAATSISPVVQVKLVYYIRFFDPLVPSQS